MAKSDFPRHHRLRLLTFPMRTRSAHGLWSDAGYPSFRRDPFARDVAFDPGGTTMPRVTALHMLRSTMKKVSAPANSSISWLNPTPHATAVYASCSASPPPHATLASRRLATALPGPDLHRLIAPALPGAFLHSITSSARASSVGGTSRPSALAVLRLITSSNFVGACTGRSAGFSRCDRRSRPRGGTDRSNRAHRRTSRRW
jgi:hypothetical protein